MDVISFQSLSLAHVKIAKGLRKEIMFLFCCMCLCNFPAVDENRITAYTENEFVD